jgi:preprotein translocase subunit SecY
MLTGLMNVVRSPDLRKKVLFTLGILVVFRIGSLLPVPNVNVTRLNECLATAQAGENASLYSMINMFSGGALLQLAVFALGIMPYITASIILQIMTVVVPRLATLKKEGAAGQSKITQYTRYLTLVLAVLNGTGIVMLAVNGQLLGACDGIVYDQGIYSIIVMILVMTAGTGLVMWLGELITERGVGNGMSVLIFTQIIARFPQQMWSIKTNHDNGTGDRGFFLFFLVVAIGLLVMLAVIFMEQGQRRIPVQYAKRMVGRKMYGGSKTYIPLKVNQSGVIPVIFASSLLYLPRLYAMMRPPDATRDDVGDKISTWILTNFVTGDHWSYNIVYALLIIAFCYFYISITFNPEEMADNMKKYGGFIPGIRAGLPTQKYIAYVLSRLTAPGSLYLTIVALIPTIAIIMINADQQFPFGGTSILIIVGVGLDTVKQIQSQLEQRSYEGFLK